MTKPTPAQLRIIVAILERGGTDVRGEELFGKANGKIWPSEVSLDACKRNGWISRDERDGIAYWSVTDKGRSAT